MFLPSPYQEAGHRRKERTLLAKFGHKGGGNIFLYTVYHNTEFCKYILKLNSMPATFIKQSWTEITGIAQTHLFGSLHKLKGTLMLWGFKILFIKVNPVIVS